MADSRHQLAQIIGKRLRSLRESRGLSPDLVEQKLILGPGWMTRFESGESLPSLSLLLVLLKVLGGSANDVLADLDVNDAEVERHVYAVESGQNLSIHFTYAKHDAVYELAGASREQFEEVLKTLRDGLSRLAEAEDTQGEAIKTDAVARTFLKAVSFWPKANPSDLWWFLVYRAYCDPYNHPANFARLDFTQSWKRTGGWALEEVLVRHYGPFLEKHGINLFIASADVKRRYLDTVLTDDRLEADKADVLLTGRKNDEDILFGVVHVKASFAERRTDDVPMSQALIRAGYVSPLWTMDCKSMPSGRPLNKGELGVAHSSGRDLRSAKRKDIEDDGYFSACFSYNARSEPTPEGQKTKARVYVCNFDNPDDAFARFIAREWRQFVAR